ncbi:MAG: AAA family ATPase [Burkholderiaceae bacterium]|nr:AAA family ATPase [Burkholderiaceae bacterium]
MDTTGASITSVDRTMVEALCAHLQAMSGQPVEMLETHISWILLNGSLAYKLKKPVRLPFLDFTELESRRRCCELELRLNRRLAPVLYLDVVPICGTAESPRIDGIGDPIDYAVCMRRFAAGALLSEQLSAGHLQAAQVEQLAQRLADFHRDAPVAARSSGHGSPEQISKAATTVLTQLESVGDVTQLRVLRNWVVEQARGLAAVWLSRRAGGAIREGHGDLHLANAVQVGVEVLAFDCIEFDPELRWIDVISDLSFLTMDLQAHGRSDLAFSALDAYLQRSGEYAGLPVLRFYEVYRALVRMLVTGLQARTGADSDRTKVPDYLACASRLIQGSRGGPRLMITHGLSGSGKSTLARQLLELVGAVRVRSDVERKRLFGLDALQRSADQDLDLYTPSATRRTFERLAGCARDGLRAGFPVIVDAAFLRRSERQAFRALAAEMNVPFSILDCQASEIVLSRRLLSRGAAGTDASEADASVLKRQLHWREPLDAHEQLRAIGVSTEVGIDIAALGERWLAAT